MTKLQEQVIHIVKGLPKDATMDDVMAELYFKMQVDAGLTELDQGNGIPHASVEKRMSRWLAK